MNKILNLSVIALCCMVGITMATIYSGSYKGGYQYVPMAYGAGSQGGFGLGGLGFGGGQGGGSFIHLIFFLIIISSLFKGGNGGLFGGLGGGLGGGHY